MKKEFVLQYKDFEEGTIDGLLQKIKSTSGVRLSELKVMDLFDIDPGEGVYIFIDSKIKLFHIGKVSSMSFVERIPHHFDIRKGAWMNRLLKIICEKHWNVEINDKNLYKAAKFAFAELKLILINFNNREKIERIERLLRSTGEPLNRFKSFKLKDATIKLKDY